MFLKQLYQYNKKLFLFFCVFIFLFVFLNYKGGLVATPVLLFGMFSQKYDPKAPLNVYRIYADKQLIDFSTLTAPQRDVLESSLDFWGREKKHNDEVFTTMNRIMNKVVVGKMMHKENYSNHLDSATFVYWYKHKLEEILDRPVGALEVEIQPCVLTDKKLTFINEPYKIITIATNQ